MESASEIRERHAALLEMERAGMSPPTVDRLQRRIDDLEAQNRYLRVRLDTVEAAQVRGALRPPLRMVRGKRKGVVA